MEKEEILLGVEMGKLEIEPVRLNNRQSENPFVNVLQTKKHFKRPALSKESKCMYISKRTVKHSAIYKKKQNKILKEPVLKVLKNCGNNSLTLDEECPESLSENVADNVKSDPLNLCTLVHNCNQLKISTKKSEGNSHLDVKNKNKWWKNEMLCSAESREPKAHSSQSGSCSQQALNPPCDVTIDELASYFETLVHIPKKMSSMAEMMYI